MKFWSSEHTFEHPWEKVVTAALRKYPNPINPAVVGLDVVDRSIDKNGVLKSHRLMATKWGLPDWAKKILGISSYCYVSEYSGIDLNKRVMKFRSRNILGMDKLCYGSEHSEVDPNSKTMKLKTRNLTFINTITIDECLVYEQHPDDPNKTQLKQHAEVTIHGVPLSSYMEKMVTDSMSSNSKKGRAAIEWVIETLTQEADELRLETMRSMDKLKHEAEDLKKETFKNVDTVFSQTPTPQKQHL